MQGESGRDGVSHLQLMGTKIDDAIIVFTGVKSGLHLKLVCVNVTLCLCYHFIGLT